MNLSMRLTMTGLIRALKATGHDLAERVERGEATTTALGQPARRLDRTGASRRAAMTTEEADADELRR